METTQTDLQAWERQPGEINLWYDRFCRFRLQGPKRSILSVCNAERERVGKGWRKSIPLSWVRASVEWHWRDRAEAFDQAERERAEAEWEERRAEIREQDYRQAKELRNLAQAILDASPGFVRERQYTRGKTKFVIQSLDGRLAVQALEASSKLQRLAAEMADPAQKVDITSGGKTISIREVVVEIPKETDGADE